MPEDLSGLSDEKLDELSKKWEKEKKYYDALKSKAEAEAAANPSEMENAKTLAEQQKAIAEAQKATLKAKLPEWDAKGPEGTITADDTVNIECHILAYQAVSEIVSYISETIKKEHPETEAVVICDRNDLNNYFSYKIFQNQLELLKKEYESVFSSQVKTTKNKDVRSMVDASLTGGSTVLSSIVDFASLFRTDVDIKGVTIEIVEEALIAELIRALKDKTTPENKEIKPIYLPFRTNVPDKFLTEISGLDKCKNKAIEEIEKFKDNKEYVESLNDLNSRYEQTEKALVSVDEKTEISRLEKLIKGEILNLELKSEGADILYLKVIKAGGNNKTKRSFWRNEIAHSGGAIIAYFLIDAEGNILKSKNLHYLSGYQRFDESNSEFHNFD